jgi:oxygen-independent coproporphyrinogen-3 oxidase
MYKSIHDHALARGLNRVSVWNFKNSGIPRFSSVTRDHYIGIGAGSGSCLPGKFYFNTFAVPDYINACRDGRIPVAVEMKLTPAMERCHWLYWRLYETRVPKLELERKFADDARVQRIFQLAVMMGLILERHQCFELTERGSFWIHLLQNYYILNYIDKVWSRAMREPWPKRIEL